MLNYDLTDEELEDGEELLDGYPCEECGRSDDWLIEGHRDGYVIARCDDCMQTSVRFPLSKIRKVVA